MAKDGTSKQSCKDVSLSINHTSFYKIQFNTVRLNFAKLYLVTK
jgi:hypothetical protein